MYLYFFLLFALIYFLIRQVFQQFPQQQFETLLLYYSLTHIKYILIRLIYPDISTLSVCILYVLENNIIKEFQIAAGGIAEKPVLLKNISRQIIGKSIDTSFETLIADIKQYINPISDLRGSSEYRINTFKGIFLKLKNHLINKVNLQSIMD